MRTEHQLNVQSKNLLSSCLELSDLLCHPQKDGILQIKFETAFELLMAVQYQVNQFVSDTQTDIEELRYQIHK